MIGIHTASGQPRRRASMPGLRLQPLERPMAPVPPPMGADGDRASTPLAVLTARTPSPPMVPSSGRRSGGRSTCARRYHQHRAVSTAGAAAALQALTLADDDGDEDCSWICGLDYDILSCIAGHMDAPTLLALSTTRRRFIQLRDDRLVWHRIYLRSFGEANVGCGGPHDDLDSLRSTDWGLRYRDRVGVYASRQALATDGPLGGEGSDLPRGKYTSWSHGNSVMYNAMPACLCAIGVLGLHYPLQTDEVSGGPNLHPHQVAALAFLRSVFDEASWRSSSSRRDTPPPIELTTDQWLEQLADTLGATQLDFEARTRWAGAGLTPSDIFGILWHIGGFAVRGWSFGRPSSHGSDRSRSITPDGPSGPGQAAGGLGLDFGALVVSTNSAPSRSDASIPAIQQINPRQLMCILHLMKLGAGEATYYQLAGVRKPLPEHRFGHIGEAGFPDMEEEAAALRSTDRSSPFAPPSCPRPSSGGITDSYGRPFEGLWGGPDDESDDAASGAASDSEADAAAAAAEMEAVPAPPMMEMQLQPEPESQQADDGGLSSSPNGGLTHLSLSVPDQLLQPEQDDNFLEPPPPPGRGRARRLQMAESVAESVRESFHFDHFADDDDEGGASDEDETEEQWSLDAPPVPRAGKRAGKGQQEEGGL